SVTYLNSRGVHQLFLRNANAPLPGTYNPAIPDSGIRPLGNNDNIYQYNSHGELGDHRQAISDYDKAIAIHPDTAQAYNSRGVAYIKLGNYRHAIEDLKTAARFGSQDAKNFLKSQGINW
ncbi:MAG: tetratricopeptide repeat protein, partial [Syntrophobacteraceae bacterium]